MSISQEITDIPAAGQRGVQTRDDFVTQQELFQDHMSDNFVGEVNQLADEMNILSGQMNTVAADFFIQLGIKYLWADAAARAAQVGMVDNEQGWQLDTQTLYKFTSPNWNATGDLNTFLSSLWMLQDDATPAAQLQYDISGLTALRKITMPDKDLTLGDVTQTTASSVKTSGTESLTTATVKSHITHIFTGTGASNPRVTGVGSRDDNWVSGMNTTGLLFIKEGMDIYSVDNPLVSSTTAPSGDPTNFTLVVSGEEAFANNAFVSKVVIKNRDSAFNNYTYDGGRGVGESLYSNLSNAENFDGLTFFTSFDSNGVTIGSNDNVNKNLDKIVLHQTIYTHRKWGVTDGIKWIEYFNPISGEGMRLREGSNSVINLPHSLGFPIKHSVTKRLNGTEQGRVFYGDKDNALALYAGASGNSAKFASTTWNNTVPTDTQFTFEGGAGAVNISGGLYVDYYSCDSANVKHGTYGGSGGTQTIDSLFTLATTDTDTNASGSTYHYKASIDDNGFVSDITIKRVTVGTGSHTKFDYQRGSTAVIFLDLSAIEGTKTGGVTDIGTTDSNFDFVTDGNTLNFTNARFTYTNGDGVRSEESFTGTTAFTGQDGITWFAKEEGLSSFVFSQLEPSQSGLYDKVSADDNRYTFQDNKWYQPDTAGDLSNNGDFETNDITGWTDVSLGTQIVDASNVTNGQITLDRDASSNTEWVEQSFLSVVGIKYTFEVDIASNDNDLFQFFLGTATQSADIISETTLGTGLSTFKWVGDGTTVYVGLKAGSGDNTVIINSAIWYATKSILGTVVPNPISWGKNPYMVASETPQTKDETKVLATNVMDSLEVVKKIKANVVEAGAEFVGDNVFSSYVTFDLTTTPITVSKSKNIKSVIESSTGIVNIDLIKEYTDANHNVLGLRDLNGFDSNFSTSRGNFQTDRVQVRFTSGTAYENANAKATVGIIGGTFK